MSSVRVCSPFSLVAVALGFFGPVCSAHSEQRLPGIFGVFGAIINSAIIDSARREWQDRPIVDFNCLTSHGTSAEQLAAYGIGPNDPRVRGILSQCAQATPAAPDRIEPQPVGAPITGPYNPDFVIDGLALGAAVHPDSPAYKAYKCRPSEQFPGFTWCVIKRPMTGKFGPYNSWTTILHSPENAAIFIEQEVTPAFFASGDVEHEIQRLSQHFGQAARILNADLRANATHAIIATWGDVTLTPLDQPTMDALRRGDTITAGLLVDYLGSAQKSARQGLPVFHLGGGSGYVWGAEFNEAGKGSLRITAIDASMLGGNAQAPNGTLAYTPTPTTPTNSAQTPEEQAHTDRDRADRLEKVVAAAKSQVEDTARFIKEHPQNPKLLDYIGKTSALNAAIGQNDPDEIERKSADLSAQLYHDKDYQQFLAARAEEQKHVAAQYLGDAIRHAQDQRAFLLDYVSKNPLAADVGNLVLLIRQIDPALAKPDIIQLQPLTEKVDLAIREANLEDAFRASAHLTRPVEPTDYSKSSKNSDGGQPALKTSNLPIPITDKNRPLMEGDLDDVLLLYNASASAPHVAQNLRGEFVFADDRADVCLLGKNPDGVALTIKSALAAFHPKTITGLNQACNALRLEAYDIVATQRGAFLNSNPSSALSLIKEIEIGAFRKFASISAADLRAAADAERAAIEQISTDVGNGGRSGYGIVLLKTNSPNLCMVTSDKVEAHSLLLLKAADKLSFDMHTSPTLSQTTAEDAFVGAQKALCGAVYASAANLKTLTEALSRANIPFAYSSAWITPADVDTADAAVTDSQRVAAQQATERVQKAADEARLRSQRAQDVNATQTAQQTTLRDKYEGAAKAAVAEIAADITTWTQSQRGRAAASYPTYAAWLAEKLSNHWDVMSINSDVQDYGTSDFKGRALDTAFARIKLRLKNQMLGEYEDDCFLFGRIADVEFSATREPIFARCDDEAAIKLWQTGHQFQSRWIVSD